MSLTTKLLLAEAVDELILAHKHLNLAMCHVETANDRKVANSLVSLRDQVNAIVEQVRNKLDGKFG